ncbi:hypothetical protein DL96DRAFT_1471249, partial [Flagelloscypha sp. PMI_526]
RYADALELSEQVLKDSRRTLGSEHPDTLQSMRNLAVTYSALGRHVAALELQEEVLEISKRVFSPDHPIIAKYQEYMQYIRWKAT